MDNESQGAEEGAGGGEVEVEVEAGSPLLLAMLDNLRDPLLETLLEKLDAVLSEGTVYSRNSAAMRHQVM